MDDRFLQQLKKGVLEMLVLELICESPTYGYELLAKLKVRSNELFALKEGTLYPILYRLEDDGLIESHWSSPEGRVSPKKMYAPTESGLQAQYSRRQIWSNFTQTVNGFYKKGENGHG